MSAAADNLDELRAALRANAAAVATALLGERNKAASTKRTWRWGTKGSLSVEVAGPKRGLWYTHEGNWGSDLLGLIQHVNGWRFPAACEWACRQTGIYPDGVDNDRAQGRRRAPSPPLENGAAAAEADQRRRIAFAQRIAAESVPVKGTLGERYLKQVRGIPEPGTSWPSSTRWHVGHRALIFVMTAVDDMVTAVQRIHLAKDGEKIGAHEMQGRRLLAVKMTNGVTDGAVVHIPGPPDAPLLIAEGPETGLSVHTSTGFETWIALGSISKVHPPLGRKVVVIADDNPPAHDVKHGQAAKALRKALQTWSKVGVDFVLATPWRVRRRDRSDFADVILEHGPTAVKARIQEALEPARAAARRVTVQAARRLVAEAVGAFFERVSAISVARAEQREKAAAAQQYDIPISGTLGKAGPPTVFDCIDGGDLRDGALSGPIQPATLITFTHGVRVDVGVGKSHEAREMIAATLVAMRARGDQRCIVLAVPMHALSDEQAERFRELASVKKAGLRVAIWRGRAAKNPDIPWERMCGNLDAVRDAQAVGLSAQTACCKRKLKAPDGSWITVTCPFFDWCAYQAQTKIKADLWIVASDLLWHEKPKAFGEVAALVVDEGAWRKGLLGAEGQQITLSVDAIGEDVATAGILGLQHGGRLRDLRRQLLDIVRQLPDGPVHRAALLGRSEEIDDDGDPVPFSGKPTLLTADSAAEALKLEYARKVETLHPGQSKEERRAALALADGNRTINRFAMVWNALRVMLSPDAPTASGWLSVGTEQTKDGPVRVLHLKGRRDIAKDWKVPTLLLDVLLPLELVSPFWPDIELVADVKVQMPHQHVRQVVDRAFALSMLAPLDEEAAANNPEEAQRRTNRLHDLRAILIREARRYAPGRVLAVLQKRIKEALSDLGSLPANLELAHHNNVAGRDEWRDVAALIVVGRTLPTPSAVRQIAEALTGQATTDAADWYERTDALREMANSSFMQAEADVHPDPLVESIRWQSCEGELVQIIGRARGVNRTADNPVDVLVLTDVPIPMPLAGTLSAVELTPGPADLMIAAGGVAIENPTDASLAFPFLWANRNTAKSAFQRAKLGAFPYKDSNTGECTQLRRIDYKAAGRGKQAAVAGYDPNLCSDPEAFLRERLGELVWCRVEGNEPKPASTSKEAETVDNRELSPDVERMLEPTTASSSAASTVHSGIAQPSGPLVCDSPCLHADAPAFSAEDSAASTSASQVYGGRHRHRFFVHRPAYCAASCGYGYVFGPVHPLPPGSGAGWPLGP